MLEKHPNMYQHEIAMMSEENSGRFPLLAITNLDHMKTLHLAKGEVVGFARPESSEVTYIATTKDLNIEEVIETGFHNENGVHRVKQYQSRKLRIAISENIRGNSDRFQTAKKQGR